MVQCLQLHWPISYPECIWKQIHSLFKLSFLYLPFFPDHWSVSHLARVSFCHRCSLCLSFVFSLQPSATFAHYFFIIGTFFSLSPSVPYAHYRWLPSLWLKCKCSCLSHSEMLRQQSPRRTTTPQLHIILCVECVCTLSPILNKDVHFICTCVLDSHVNQHWQSYDKHAHFIIWS